MSTAELAIIISIFSVVVAAISLGWNIYRDVVLKPKVIVTFAVKNIVGAGMKPSPDFVGITATNHGPGAVILNTVVLREYSLWKKITKKHKYAVLMHDYENPYSSKMPRKLEVGESLDLFVNYDAECFLKETFTQLGVSDSFGRTNWASSKTMKELRNKWKSKFSENT